VVAAFEVAWATEVVISGSEVWLAGWAVAGAGTGAQDASKIIKKMNRKPKIGFIVKVWWLDESWGFL
jgi:nucleoid-associated protein YgaU